LTRVGSLGSLCPMGRPKRADEGGLMPQSLAPDRLAAPGRRSLPVRRLADADPHPAVTRAPTHPGERSRLSGAVQVVPGPGRRALSHRLPLRRAQCFAGEPGRASRRLAMVQLGPSKAIDSRGASRLSAWTLERPRNWVELVTPRRRRPSCRPFLARFAMAARSGRRHGRIRWCSASASR
jgi:hypothetical protein